MVWISDLAMPWSLTGSLRSNPWIMLAMVLGEMGSVCGIGISIGTLLLGEQNGRGSSDEVHDKGM